MTNAEQEYDIQERDAVRGDLEREALAELTEERFGPLPQREPGAAGRRLRVIAAIHALADHLAAHPDVPTPSYITAGCHLKTREEVAAVAADLGCKLYADGSQMHLELAPAEGRDLATTIIVSAAGPGRPL
jgi:hypothetical protein